MNRKKLYRKMRRWLRRNRILLPLLCVFAVFVLILCTAGNDGNDDYDDFRDALGMRESSDDYTKVNRYHYLGRYQLGQPALEDAGFLDENGAWTSLANSYGIFSENDFLNSPEGQDAAVTAYHTRLCSYIRFYGLEEYIGQTYCGVEVTRSGLLAACHLVGIGSIKKGLASGQHVYDGNHVSAAEYMELFSEYDISKVWQN